MFIRRHILLSLALVWGLIAVVSGQVEREESRDYVNFSFDNAELRLVIKLVGELTGKQFVVDDQVTGRVTLLTPPQIPPEQVFPFFLTILESRGYTVVRRNELYHVIPLAESGIHAAPVVRADDPVAPQGLITKIIKLEHVSAADLKRVLDPMIRGGKAGAANAFGPTNHLIITDTADNIQRIEEIIREIDQPGQARMVEVVALQHASADELARQIMTALAGAEAAGRRLTRTMQQVAEGGALAPGEVMAVAAPHANSLMLVGTQFQINELKRVVEMLDVETPSGYGRLNVIFLKYLAAEDAAKSLNALLARTADDQRPKVSVEPSIPNNALLVDASPKDFELVKQLVSQLDQVVQQVMVEILIVEVGVGRNLDLGVDWSTIEAPEEGRTTIIGRSRPGQTDAINDLLSGLFPQGLSLGVARGTFIDAEGRVQPRIPFLLRALSENRDVKILSNIPLWAQNNLESSVSVVENIPILRSTIVGGAGTARDVIQNIERMDVGIRLNVTPYINPDQDVRMKLNPVIEAIIDEGPPDTQFAPTIAKREVSTTVTIPNKSTVVISGLIREDQIRAVSKVPLLGDIPLLGHLFRNTSTRAQRTNLLIFVTPHIVTDMQEAIAMRESLEDKTDLGDTAADRRISAPSKE